MNINIKYSVSSFDPDKFIELMNVVIRYAASNKDLEVCATDTSFIVSDPAEFMEPSKIKSVKEIMTGLENDLHENEEQPEQPAEETEVEGQEEKPDPPPTPAEDGLDGVCKNCDHPFHKKRKNSCFCSEECRKEYFNHGKKSRAERGEEVTEPEEETSPEPAPAPVVKPPVPPPEEEGLSLVCEVCEMPFKSRVKTRFCPKCLSTFGTSECISLAEDTRIKKEMEKEAKKIKFKVCPRCGHNFEAKEPDQFFCDKCTAKALKQPKIQPLPKE